MTKKINILIDATNIKTGGGYTHLYELLNNYKNLAKYNIYILGPKKTLSKFNFFGIKLIESFFLNHSAFFAFIWKYFFLKIYILKYQINLMFAPGGWFINVNIPVIILSQNFILFNDNIIRKYIYSLRYFKFKILKYLHIRSINNSSGVIYLHKFIEKNIKNNRLVHKHNSIIIPHGINKIFDNKKLYFLNNKIINIVYVSNIDYYKNQLEVILTIIKLNQLGYKINLQLIGSYYKPYAKKILKKINSINFISIFESKSFEELSEVYKKSDIAIFASSCENLPITLIEYMRSSMPILCNNIEPMRSILDEGGIFFDIDIPNSMIDNLIKLIESPSLRKHLSNIAYKRSLIYSWEKTSNNTFNFIDKVYESFLKQNTFGND